MEKCEICGWVHQSGSKQSRKMSLIETLTNITVGYCLAVVVQLIVFPWFDIETRIVDNLQIGLAFTVVAIARGYGIRRLFELFR